jgi:hypothetical protein
MPSTPDTRRTQMLKAFKKCFKDDPLLKAAAVKTASILEDDLGFEIAADKKYAHQKPDDFTCVTFRGNGKEVYLHVGCKNDSLTVEFDRGMVKLQEAARTPSEKLSLTVMKNAALHTNQAEISDSTTLVAISYQDVKRELAEVYYHCLYANDKQFLQSFSPLCLKPSV